MPIYTIRGFLVTLIYDRRIIMKITSVQGQDMHKIISGKFYDDHRKLTNNELSQHRPAKTGRTEKPDFSKAPSLSNRDKFVLNLPASETIYKRQEFTTDERMAEGCAYCYTYMERVLDFGSGLMAVSRSSDGYFVINADKDKRTFSKSGAVMNDIAHAVEETWERRERSLEQTTVSGSLSGSFTKNGHTFGGSLEFAVQNTVYKYLSVSETRGMVAYKNGAVSAYREKAVSFREIYNRCAAFLAKAFGEKGEDMLLDERDISELFDKLNDEEKTFSEKPEQKRGAFETKLGKLREFMERNLFAARQKAPDSGSLKIFEDTYSKLKTYDFSDIASLVEKILAAENAADSEK